MKTLFRLLLPALCLLGALPAAHAQISVTLEIKRRIYLRYEPILATVKITNLSGRDLVLRDAEQPWFGFDVTGSNTETLVPPRDPDYKLDPLELKLGETVKRTVNLTDLYGISEYGLHRIKALIFNKTDGKVYSSKPAVVDISEGRRLWSQNVGVPETFPNAGQTHTVTLVEFQADRRYLYVRIEDKEAGHIFCMYRIGHMIDGADPQMQFDTTNGLYVLHLIGPKTYTLTNIGVNGEYLGQQVYTAPKARPYLRRLADGTIQIVGGQRQTAPSTAAGGAPAPTPAKLSDRPPGLPL